MPASGRILIEKTLAHAVLADPSPEGVRRAQRDMVAQVREDLRARGIGPNDYQLEARFDPQSVTWTLVAHELDPMTRPLSFDDRGIV